MRNVVKWTCIVLAGVLGYLASIVFSMEMPAAEFEVYKLWGGAICVLLFVALAVAGAFIGRLKWLPFVGRILFWVGLFNSFVSLSIYTIIKSPAYDSLLGAAKGNPGLASSMFFKLGFIGLAQGFIGFLMFYNFNRKKNPQDTLS